MKKAQAFAALAVSASLIGIGACASVPAGRPPPSSPQSAGISNSNNPSVPPASVSRSRDTLSSLSATEPQLSSSYEAAFHNVTYNRDADGTLTVIKEDKQGNISGTLTVEPPLYGGGPFTGTVSGTAIKFTVTSTSPNDCGCKSAVFTGTVNPQASALSGTYIANTTGPTQNGTWKAQSVGGSAPSSATPPSSAPSAPGSAPSTGKPSTGKPASVPAGAVACHGTDVAHNIDMNAWANTKSSCAEFLYGWSLSVEPGAVSFPSVQCAGIGRPYDNKVVLGWSVNSDAGAKGNGPNNTPAGQGLCYEVGIQGFRFTAGNGNRVSG